MLRIILFPQSYFHSKEHLKLKVYYKTFIKGDISFSCNEYFGNYCLNPELNRIEQSRKTWSGSIIGKLTVFYIIICCLSANSHSKLFWCWFENKFSNWLWIIRNQAEHILDENPTILTYFILLHLHSFAYQSDC